MKQLKNELCIDFTYEELARLNTMVGIALRSGKIERDDISNSIHKKVADEIIRHNSGSADTSRTEKDTTINKLAQNTKSSILHFLAGEGTDNRGRFLSDLWKKGNFFLETCHDYIQWMFPLNEESQHNSKAPVLTKKEIAFIRSNKTIQKNMLKSLDVMLRFYGLERDGKKFQRGENFEKRRKWWITKNNHNFLRITRILKSLKLCGLEDYAWAFLRCLKDIYMECSAISDKDFSHWNLERM